MSRTAISVGRVIGPSYLASALINGDTSGLAPDELIELERFREYIGKASVVSCDDESWFGRHNGIQMDVTGYMTHETVPDPYFYEVRRWDSRQGVDRPWRPDDFTRGAIEAAFFTCDPFISSGEYCLDWDSTWNKLDPRDRARFVERCQAFQTKHEKLLRVACARTGNDMAHAGRDYHYTSAGHGCGFWDGDWKRFGDALEAACKAMPLPEVQADVDCEHYRETGSACGDCDGCEAGARYYLA